jgi:excisionase family DNA binding protein
MRKRKGVSVVSNDGPALEVTQSLLTAEEVAKILRFGVVTVKRLTRRGELPVVRLGHNSPRYRRSDVEAFIQSKMS